MPHQQVAQALREDEVRGGGLAADGEEDAVARGVVGEGRGGRGGDFGEAGEGVGEATVGGDVRDVDWADRVAEGLVVGEGGVAGVEDGGVGGVEVGGVDS